MKKRLPLIILGILAIGALVYWRIISTRFTYAGTVEATEVDVAAQEPSTILTRPVDEGQAVTQGQLMATLDGTDYKIQQSLSTDDYNRGVKLFKSGSMSQENFNHLQSQKELADLHVQWCTIAAPITGRVLTKYHEPGEWVGPGTKLFTLADLRQVWCYFYVPQPMLVKVNYGQKVTARLPEMPDKVFSGTITHINDEAEFTPKNVQTQQERSRLIYGVKITFDNPDGLLKPGMTLEADLPKE